MSPLPYRSSMFGPRLDPVREMATRRVRKRLYVFLFIFLTFLFSTSAVEVFHQDEAAFPRLERIYQRPSLFRFPARDQPTDEERARELGIELQQLYTAEIVMEKYLRQLESQTLGPLDWGFSFFVGNYILRVKYQIFLNMAISALIAWALYIRSRDRAASIVIDDQNKQLRELNTELEQRIEEAQRYLGELQQAQSKLVQAQKLASIGRLSATLAHEIRNPMSIMMSAAGMAADDVPPGSPPAQAIDLIRQEITRLDRIVDELLNFARPKPPRLDTHDLNGLVATWIRPLAEELEKHQVKLKATLSPKVRPVQIDVDQLYQVFLNVLWNARDAVRENGGGTITLTTEDDGEGAAVYLIVADDGPGMDRETLQQVYEPFFTTKTSGSGLGLPVVQQLMEGMGGTIAIESELERGTTVHLHLRAARG